MEDYIMITTFIVNGEQAQPSEFPFYCSLNSSSDADVKNHCCGAVLINKRWVLTAAHCVDACRAKTVYVGLEKYKPNALYKDRVDIEKTIVHPNWITPPKDPSGWDIPYDIALIKLTRDTVSNDFAVINGMKKIVDFPVGTEMIVAGCGDTEYGHSSSVLLKTILLIVDDKNCVEVPAGYPPTRHDGKIHICTRGNNTSTGGGDSGGPLMLKDKTVVGLTTRTLMNNTNEFTRVSWYCDWIKSIINE